MKYHDGTPVTMGDIVTVPMPDGTARARVVMLGETCEHLEIDHQFLEWVKRDRQLDPSSVVLEWVGTNSLAQEDPRFARRVRW